MSSADLRCMYLLLLQDAAVHHWIPPDRTTWSYIWRYFVGVGRTRARLYRRTRASGPPDAAQELASHLLRAGLWRVVGRPSWAGA